jgi:Fe-S-cluster containining protein
VDSLETELDRARDLSVSELADAIEAIGFECTRCGGCCKAAEGEDGEQEPHTATVFPDEVRALQDSDEYDHRSGDAAPGSSSAPSLEWRDVARPMPYGLTESDDDLTGEDDLEGEDDPEGEKGQEGEGGLAGETFEWALQTDDCGDCTFYEENDDPDAEGGGGSCTVYGDRPLVCRTYPFSVALGGTSQPLGEAVDQEGMVRAHECEGLGRDISREEAEELAATLKERAVRELEEAIDVRETYEPAHPDPGEVVVHDSEGQKRPDGSPR